MKLPVAGASQPRNSVMINAADRFAQLSRMKESAAAKRPVLPSGFLEANHDVLGIEASARQRIEILWSVGRSVTSDRSGSLTPQETSAACTASSTVVLKAVDFGFRTVTVTSGMLPP
jgi:hypothetical protein